MSLTIAILAGGRSTRMGQDKAEIEFEGVTLLERSARTAAKTGLPVLVVGRVAPQGWRLASVCFAEDDLPGCGPLGGLVTAIRHTRTSVMLIACDMPLLTAEALHWLCDSARAVHSAHGVVTIGEAGPEPLFSVYHPSCLALAEHVLVSGQAALRSLIASGDFALIEAPAHISPCLASVNTPSELSAVRARVSSATDRP